jgi:hypothetical protein
MDIFIDTYYENASPLKWEQNEDGVIDIDMIHDHARFSPNQQFTHWNFKIEIPEEHIGESVKLRVRPINCCWNGTVVPALGRPELVTAISYDGKNWENLQCEIPENSELGMEFNIKLKSKTTQLARLVPFTDSMLQKTVEEIKDHPAVRVYNMGSTVEGRPLEMIEIGNPDASAQVLIRGRAHPWESGGSWLIEGLIRRLLKDDKLAADILDELCFCLMPMSCKDGVYRGMTRFNVKGIDLNRGWLVDEMIDPELVPENACLQNWLAERRRLNKTPKLAICLHNDNEGNLHFSHKNSAPEGYFERMEVFEKLLTDMTWFTEGAVSPEFHNPGTFGDGLCAIYGMDAFIFELKAICAEGLGRAPLHKDWMQMGGDFANVVREYFKSVS